jgi:antibiotic biosynthesis monooxygenase (ABM) superfamily enzyme
VPVGGLREGQTENETASMIDCQEGTRNLTSLNGEIMNNQSSPKKPTEPVAVLALRTVKPGLEVRFEAALHDFISQSLQTEGQLGVSVIRPVQESGSREYGILRRFRDSVSRDRFYESALFQQWESKVAALTEGEAKRQHLSGLETWFVLPGQRALIPPPPWKMAVVTVLGVWPVSILVPWLLNPLMGGMPLTLQALFVAVGIVILLTWVVMPVLVRILKPWLYPS